MEAKKKLLAYLVIPAFFSIMAYGIYIFAGASIWSLVVSEFKLAAVKGAPEYSYVGSNSQGREHPEEEISEGEVKSLLAGTMLGEVNCEKIGLKAPLYYGDSNDIFEKGIGIYTGSKIPGEGGTILAGGHDTTFMTPLEQIAKGDEIVIITAYGEYRYEVTNLLVADVTEAEAYQLHNDREELILYTCYPFGDITKERTHRYYVYAKKVSGQRIQEVE